MIRRLSGIALLIPLLSSLTSPAVPLAFRALLVVMWTMAVVRPHWALTALLLIVPFASWLLFVVNAPPVRFAEALVLATLSGGLIAAARPRRTPLEGQRPALGPAAVVFTTIAFASAAVMLTVMQAGTHTPWPFIRSFLTFLTRDYLVGPPGAFAGFADAALLVEGIGLMALVAHHARDHVVRPAQLFAAAAVAGGAAAVVTLTTFVATALQAPTARDFFLRLAFSRMGVHVADLNAAGSFFAMTMLVAGWHAVTNRPIRQVRRRWVWRAGWSAIALLIVAGMWISGSRMAIIAALVGLGVLAAMAGPLRAGKVPRWVVVSASICGVLAIVAIALGLDPRPSFASRSASRILSMRADFMITGLRMIASAPIFGVGVGRYFELSGQFMPQSIYWFYFHENAHNNFLQIGGELGLVGLAAFVWLLAVAAIRLARGVRADPRDRLLLGAVVALGAFVATWMTSHPMLVAEVAYPFWMLLGAALARADGNVQQTVSRSNVAQPFRAANVMVAAITIALAVSVPFRANREMAAIDLGRFDFGFYDWEGDPERFRWTSRRATFFVPLNARELHLRLRARHLGANTAPTEVSIAIGGRTFNRVVLADDNWVTVSMRLPLVVEDDHFRRIDITTEPTWSPAVLFGGRSDVRVLGVQMGEPFIGY